MDFKVNVPCYSLHAWLDWRLNIEDPMQIQSAPLLPEPICNHNELVPNEFDPDLLSHTIQLVEIPVDNLLDHPPALAMVDGIPGSQPLLAVPLACTQGDLAVASNSSLPHVEAIY